MPKARKSNLELLRIISMIFIVMSHCDDIFGLYNLYSISLGINKIITDWLHIGGQIGVGCFLLISGYFMIDQNISLKKILNLVGEVWFYTIGLWIIWIIKNVSLGNLIIKECFIETLYAFFPILFGHYWFVTAYVILMIVSPFLNKLIFSLDHRNYGIFLSTILVIFVVLDGGVPIILSDMTGGRLIAVFIMYFIAGYIRRFGKIERNNILRHLSIAIILYFVLFATFYCFTYIGITLDIQTILNERYFYRVLNSPIIVIICIELFKGFLGMDIKCNKLINEIAGCTFGVYLIHSNRLMSSELSKIFPIYKETRPLLILLYSVVSMIVIYAVSILIDYIRKRTIGKLWEKLLDKYANTIQNKFTEITNCILNCIVRWIEMF